jgi:tRNA (guanine37-N1)-methyltransferase
MGLLKDRLAGLVPAGMLPLVSGHFEVIGDVAVLSLPGEPGPWKRTVAEAVVAGRRNIVTVLNRTGKRSGGSRTARYEVLLGERTVTLHREYGFSYRLDVSAAFFSTRMASERQRVTGQVLPGERVYVPFAGVGPFVIPAAARGAQVVAGESHPAAYRYLVENAGLNHAEANIHPFEGDALDTSRFRPGEFDRIIIPTPYGMDHALPALLPLLAAGGMVHFYTFKTREEIPGLVAAFRQLGLTIQYHARCGNVAPGVSRRVFDMSRE